ncbi:hypothetical protein E4U55_004136 [Claviceps digitariae]|nr:hypothetical protein E4U55_004136 [Claviceps digitariae]
MRHPHHLPPLLGAHTGSQHKREQQSSSHTLELNPRYAVTKKQKLHYPAFFSGRRREALSKIPLTRKALRALNEQNSQVFLSTKTLTRARSLPSHPLSVESVQPQLTIQDVDSASSIFSGRVEAYARNGGPDLTDIRGYYKPEHRQNKMSAQDLNLRQQRGGLQSSSNRSLLSSAKNSVTTNTTIFIGPLDDGFRQHLIDHNILPPFYKYPKGEQPKGPNNMDEICRLLERPDPTLSAPIFSDEDFKKFTNLDASADSKVDVIRDIIPLFQGDIDDRTCVAFDIEFTELECLTNGKLLPGNPDIYYGSHPEQLCMDAREELSNYVQTTTKGDAPIVPNFLLQARGLDDSLLVAIRQAYYVGALAARGIHRLQCYKTSKLQYDNKAYTLTSVYHGGQLKMYTVHPTQPATRDGQPGFVVTHIKSWLLTGDVNSFRQGVSAFRNGRAWAERQRDLAINEANKRYAQYLSRPSSPDELSLDYTFPVNPVKRTRSARSTQL